MQELIERLEKATGPDRELDEGIAVAIGLWKPWLSKHRRWNFNGPDGKSFSWPDSIPAFDGETGKKINLTETPWSGWADEARLPAWTESIDAALTLVPENFAIHEMGHSHRDRRGWYVNIISDRDSDGHHAVPAIALCIAALRARQAMRPLTDDRQPEAQRE